MYSGRATRGMILGAMTGGTGRHSSFWVYAEPSQVSWYRDNPEEQKTKPTPAPRSLLFLLIDIRQSKLGSVRVFWLKGSGGR